MSNRILIRLLWITSLGSLFLVIVPYAWNFFANEVSKDSTEWGQFGDYIGGILNPIFALLNLIVLTYLTITIVKNEDERNKFTLQELARPLGDVSVLREKEEFNISLGNWGLGPLRIKKMTIIYDEKEYSSYKNIFPAVPSGSGIKWEYWNLMEGDESVLAKDKSQVIVNLAITNKTRIMPPYFQTIYEILYKTKITFEYVDIYDRPMPSASFDFTKIVDKVL